MKSVNIPWGAWYEEKETGLSFPEHWDVEVCEMEERESIDSGQIKKALEKPFGSERLSSLVKGRKKIAIAVEDNTRPSYIGDIVSLITEELELSGIKREDIKLIVCNGAHRPLNRMDFLKKFGSFIVENYLIINHNPYDNLADTGICMGKVPVTINKYFLDADFRILVGSILPHAFAGFSGGAKLVIPGLSGIDVLARSHKFVLMGFRGGVGSLDNNKFRAEIERIVSEIGIDFFVGYVPNSKRRIVNIFTGDFVTAHRAGVSFAEKVYETKVPDEIDIAVLNAYPKDTDLLQADAAFSAVKLALNNVKDNGKIILTSACSEGFGFHSLFAPGMKLYRQPSRKRFLAERDLLFFSPNINYHEFRMNFWEGYGFFDNWESLINSIVDRYPDSCKVAVFPTAPLQLARE